jgi:hypothetical protein
VPVLLAAGFCILLTVISLLSPPAVNFDPGIGFLEWRTLVQGGLANSVTAPDPADISKDVSEFVPWWKSGTIRRPWCVDACGLAGRYGDIPDRWGLSAVLPAGMGAGVPAFRVQHPHDHAAGRPAGSSNTRR